MSASGPRDRRFHRDPDWYRATYNAAVGYVLLHDSSKKEKKKKEKKPETLHEAELMARELVEHIERVLIEAAAPREPLFPPPIRQQVAQTLAPFLSKVEPTALIMLAGVLRRLQREREGEKPKPTRPTPQGRVGRGVEGTPGEVSTVDQELVAKQTGQKDRLDVARGRAPQREARIQLLKKLQEEPMTHAGLIDWTVANLSLDYRARYNLACYVSGRGDDASGEKIPDAERHATENYQHALRELETSLVAAPADLLGWAQKDPALRGVRESPSTKAKFRELIDSLEAGDNKPPAVDLDEAHDRLLRRVAQSLARLPGVEVTRPVGENQPDVIVQVGRRKFVGEIRADEQPSTAVLRRALRRLTAIVDEQPAIEEGFLAVPDSALLSPVAAPVGIAVIRASDADDWLRARVE